MRLLLSTVGKLCPQLGISVDEIDNLDMSAVKANKKDISETMTDNVSFDLIFNLIERKFAFLE